MDDKKTYMICSVCWLAGIILTLVVFQFGYMHGFSSHNIWVEDLSKIRCDVDKDIKVDYGTFNVITNFKNICDDVRLNHKWIDDKLIDIEKSKIKEEDK